MQCDAKLRYRCASVQPGLAAASPSGGTRFRASSIICYAALDLIALIALGPLRKMWVICWS
jgi:hypothetical protein